MKTGLLPINLPEERGIYAASQPFSIATSKRHKCRAPVHGFNARIGFWRILLLVIAFSVSHSSILAAPVNAGDAAARFDAANKLYEQGKFAEATQAYAEIRQSGVASPALYFNLGNALFKSSKIGSALAAYRQAEQLAPRDPDVRANLQFARNQVQGPTRRAGRIERWFAKLSLNEWTTLACGALWVTCVLLVVAQLQPKLARTLRNATLGVGIATVIFGTCLGFAIANQSDGRIAIVTSRDLMVRNGPFDESPSAFTAQDGAEFRVLDHKDDWLQVTDDNRRTGWVRRSNVALPNNS